MTTMFIKRAPLERYSKPKQLEIEEFELQELTKAIDATLPKMKPPRPSDVGWNMFFFFQKTDVLKLQFA